MLQKLFFVVFILNYLLPLSAQHCVTPDAAFGRKPAVVSTSQPRGLMTIPVVVHVVWKEQDENISEAQILSQIEALNRDFQQKNDQSGITSDFLPLAANIGIEFCLAKTDPKGKATTGITRTKTSYTNVWGSMGTTQNNPTPRRRIYHTLLEGRDAWDTKKYLNIWVGRLGNGKAGYGTFPDGMKPEDVDGIVVDPQFFGTVGTAANNAGFNQGRTAVHEVGHYLNLYHPWGTSVSNFDCNGDDFVADTPKQEEAVTNCPSTFVFHCGKKVMTMNFMNFVYDDCMSMFTLGQKNRMLDALLNSRAGLLNATACQPVSTLDNLLIDNVLVYPNPARENVTIELRELEKASYTLYDIAGRLVAQGDLQREKNSINVADLAAGFYQLGLSNGQQVAFKSLVIQ